MHDDAFCNSREREHLGTQTIPNRGKTTSEEIMIPQAHQLSIAGRMAFRALALAGAVTLVVTAGCGGGSSGGNADTGPSVKNDAGPDAPLGPDAQILPDAASPDTVVIPTDTVSVGPEVPVADVGPDVSPDHAVNTPDASDAAGVDSSTPMDGAGGNCPSAANAWGYQLPGTTGLVSVAWDKDGTLLTGATFYPYPIPGLAGTTPTGTFGGKSVTNKGSADLLVAKLDPSTGNANWVLTAGDGFDQYFGGAVPVGTTAAVHGTFKGTIALPVNGVTKRISNPNTTPIDYLIGLNDSDGSALWSQSIDLGGGAIYTLAANSGKDYFLVCGYATNDASDLAAVGTPGGGADVVVAAVKSDGTVVWAKLFGGAMDQKCLSAALDDNGNAYFAGTYAGSLDFGGGALPVPTAASVDGGATAVPAIAWVAKFKGADGTFLAAKSFGTTANVTPATLSLDPQGALLMAGSFNADVTFGTQLLAASGGTVSSGADAFVAKLDSSSLAPVWARSLAAQPGSTARCSGIASDSAGNVTVTGQFTRTLAVGPGNNVLQGVTPVGSDVYVVTLSGASGNTLCAKNFGDPASSGLAANGISVNSRATGTNKDRTAIVGFFSDVINFGGSTTTLSSGSVIQGTKQGFLLEM